MLKGPRWLWAIIIGVVLFLLASLTVDFRFARSETTSEHQQSTYASGETLPENMTGQETLAYSVEGDDAIARALVLALEERLEGLPSVGDAGWQDGLPGGDSLVLVVEVESSSIRWTPFYSRATVQAEMAFASDGDLSFRGTTPVVFDSREGPVVKADGEYSVRDRSWGWLSLPGYHRHLAEQLAEEIARGLSDVFAER